jgi:hypothetical protein
MTNSLSSNPQTYSNEVTITSTSSITFESPKLGGRQRDFIWSFFNDMGVPTTYILSYSDYHVSLFGVTIDILSYSHIYVS